VSGSFVHCHFHAGPKLDVTNSKKIKKNARPSCGIFLYHLDVDKIQTLIKETYQKVSSQK
jgi:hypothetical protein